MSVAPTSRIGGASKNQTAVEGAAQEDANGNADDQEGLGRKNTGVGVRKTAFKRSSAASPKAASTEPAGYDKILTPDALSTGLLFVLATTVVQRLVGMVRSVYFCDLMPEAEVGLFSLGFSSLMLLAPFAVLGIPGSFGRYVEYYRQRNALGAYLRRTIATSLCLGAGLSAVIMIFAPYAAVVLFNDASQTRLAWWTGASLFFVVAFNLLAELSTALRKTRRASWMQFVCSIAFAVIGLSLLWAFNGKAEAALIGYSAACAAACLVAWPLLRAVWRISDTPEEPLTHQRMWSKLAPYTAWFWGVNLLTNLFDILDRYLILWWSTEPAQVAQGLVGQLHSARVFPVLIVGLATMAAGILLPHLSHDWELGLRVRVSRHLRLAVKLASLVFTLVCSGVLVAAPLIFHLVWNGRYDRGLALLPVTCTMCVWQCLTIMVQQYLWCTERARLACAPLFVGLVMCVALNAYLIPRYGIEGAAVAAAAANLAALSTSIFFAHLLGLKIELRSVLFLLWPGVLLVGVWSSLLAAGIAAVGSAGMLYFFLRSQERWLLQREASAMLERLRRYGFAPSAVNEG